MSETHRHPNYITSVNDHLKKAIAEYNKTKKKYLECEKRLQELHFDFFILNRFEDVPLREIAHGIGVTIPRVSIIISSLEKKLFVSSHKHHET